MKIARVVTSAVLAVVLWGVPANADLSHHIKVTRPHFGKISVGETERDSVTVTNHSDTPFQITEVITEAVFFSERNTTCLGALLQPGESCTIRLLFAPPVGLAPGTYDAFVEVSGYFVTDSIDSTCCDIVRHFKVRVVAT